MIDNRTKPDLKEGFYVAQDLPFDHPQGHVAEVRPCPNLWPESLGDHFQDTCLESLNRITA
jgi:isopenicillin N synthase-like dioxygenase